MTPPEPVKESVLRKRIRKKKKAYERYSSPSTFSKSPVLLWHLFLVILSVSGLVSVTEFFPALSSFVYAYPFGLLHIISGNDVLSSVIRAVTKNATSLLWVRRHGA